MNKFITMIVSVVVVIVLISAILIPVVDQAHDTFTIRETVVFNNTGDEVTLGSQDEEYTVDWDSALPGTIKVNGSTPTVYFVAGEGASVSPTQKDVVEGLTYGELPLPTRTGYTFDGWYTSTEYTTEVTDTTVVVGTEDKILYAKWIGNTYTVTFDADGGTVSPATKTVTFGSAYGELPVPTYTEHTFGGWVDADNNFITAITEVSIASDHTLTAVWTPGPYLVSFASTTGGSVSPDTPFEVPNDTAYTISSNTITIGETTITATANEGYHFVSWTPGTSGTVNASLTFTATFEADGFDLTFTTDGTTGATVDVQSYLMVPAGTQYVVADNTVTVTGYGTVTASLPDGYYFTGWSVAQGVGIVSANTTFEAQYELIEIVDLILSSRTTWILDSTGHVWGCGDASNGQQSSGTSGGGLIVNTFTDRTPNGITVEQVSASQQTTWILDSTGHVWGCGMGTYGQQSSGGTSEITSFTDRTPNGITVEQVSASQQTTWILDSTGHVWGCGWDEYGQQSSGVGGSGAIVDTFTDRTPNGVTVEQVSATTSETWILDSTGHVWGCGSNYYGQQSSGSSGSETNVNTFTDRTPNGVTVEQVISTGGTTWILDSTGHVWGCGNNTGGQQSSGSSGNNAHIKTFTDRTPNGVTVEQVSATVNETWILDSTGHVWGCGANGSGQQSSGTSGGSSANVKTFTDRTPNGITVEQVSASTSETWILDSTGHVWGCGNNLYGQQSSGNTTNILTLTQRIPQGSINITPVLSPQINPLSPINLNPLHPFTPIPIQPMSIDYTAITGFSTWQMGGEDWMLATVTTGVDEYALALYYAGLTEPLVWDEDVHMVFDNGTLTVENGGNTYTMTYSSIYYRASGGTYRLLNTSATVLDDTPILAYGVPTDDSGALARGTVGNLTAVSIADGQITLDGATATYSNVEGFDTAKTLTGVSFQYDDNGTSPAIAVIVPSSVSVTHLTENKMLTTVLDVIPVILIIGTLMVLVSALFMGRRY